MRLTKDQFLWVVRIGLLVLIYGAFVQSIQLMILATIGIFIIPMFFGRKIV